MYWLEVDVNQDPVAIYPEDVDHPIDCILIEENDPRVDVFVLGTLKSEKVKAIRLEGVQRINEVYPSVSEEDMKFYADFWLSIAPAARNAKPDFQLAIDIYTAAKQAKATVNGYTTVAEVEAYDPVASPNWP